MRKLLTLLCLFLAPLAHAATVVQTNGNTCSGCSTTLAASFSSLPTATHTVIVTVSAQIYNQGGITLADNQSGNTYVKVIQYQTHQGNQATLSAIFWVSSVASPSGTFTVTATFPATAGKASIGLIETTGTSYVDMTGIGYSGGVSGQTTITATNGYSDAGTTDVVATGFASAASNTVTTPSGYTSVANGTSVGSAYLVDSSGGTDSAAWTIGSAIQGTAVIASFGGTQPSAPHKVDVLPFHNGSSSQTTISGSLYGVVAGDMISVAFDGTNTVGSTPTVSDGTAYTQDLVTLHSGMEVGFFSRWNVSSGTHPVVVSWNNSSGTDSSLTLTEVAGMPTSDSLDVSQSAGSTGSTGPLTATTGALGNSLDFVVANGVVNNFQLLSGPSGWQLQLLSSGTTGDSQYYPGLCAATLTPGATTALSPSCGSVTSAAWAFGVVAYKPLSSGGGCTNVAYTQAGTIAVPTAGSTIVYRQDGNEGTVSCSGAPNYWQPTQGAFGAN